MGGELAEDERFALLRPTATQLAEAQAALDAALRRGDDAKVPAPRRI